MIVEVLGTALGVTVVSQTTVFFDTNDDGMNDGSTLSDDPALAGAQDPAVVGLSVIDVPTLGSWAVLLLAFGLAGIGWLTVRRS